MTDDQAFVVLAALAGEPLPWAQPGAGYRREVHARGLRDDPCPFVETGTVAARTPSRHVDGTPDVLLRLAPLRHPGVYGVSLRRLREWAEQDGDVFEPLPAEEVPP